MLVVAGPRWRSFPTRLRVRRRHPTGFDLALHCRRAVMQRAVHCRRQTSVPPPSPPPCHRPPTATNTRCHVSSIHSPHSTEYALIVIGRSHGEVGRFRAQDQRYRPGMSVCRSVSLSQAGVLLKLLYYESGRSSDLFLFRQRS